MVNWVPGKTLEVVVFTKLDLEVLLLVVVVVGGGAIVAFTVDRPRQLDGVQHDSRSEQAACILF